MWRASLTCIVLVFAAVLPVRAQLGPAQPCTNHALTQLAEYFKAEVGEIANRCLAETNTPSDLEMKRALYRRQLLEMLGLWPLPERTDLQPVVTGRIEHDGIVIETLHFQALPRLYCTANLYLPAELGRPAPAILYLSGHWRQTTNGVSFGNKTAYQYNGLLFARNGYVCLVLDTLQLGEIQGVHTGTRDLGLWWWNSRGYTPAGVEAWFGIRALDYLCSRPEVDTNRLGVTGHSGGGAYSWTVTALDDRVKAAAPLAGMADLHSHVIDGVLDRHCDCNFFINIYRWDFPQLAALAAPRPVLIGATDNDPIFRLDSTLRIYQKVRRIYELCGAQDKLGLVIAPGPHMETPELQLAVLRWFNKFLKQDAAESVLDTPKPLPRERLRVFDRLPADALNTNVTDLFAPLRPPRQKPIEQLRTDLRRNVFAGWPDEHVIPLELQPVTNVVREGVRLRIFNFTSQHHTQLRLYMLDPPQVQQPERVVLEVLDAPDWRHWLSAAGSDFANELREELACVSQAVTTNNRFATLKMQLAQTNVAFAYFAPRGIGRTAWTTDEQTLTKIRRRFMLLGQTLDGMRVWDIRRAIQAIIQLNPGKQCTIELRACRHMAVNALYAALFEPAVKQLELSDLPSSHMDGPDYLNVLKVTDISRVAEVVATNLDSKQQAK